MKVWMPLLGFWAAVAAFGPATAAPMASRPATSQAAALPFSQPVSTIKTRPLDAGALDSTRFPLRVHYAEGVDLAYAQDILHIAEQSWDKLFVQGGFLAPLPDGTEGGDNRTDLYIITSMQKGVGGYTSFSGFNDATPRADAIGYVVYAHDLAPLYRRGVVAHELFHLSQMAYDWWEELSSEAMTLTVSNDGRFSEVIVVVSDLGDGHFDPNGTPWDKVPFHYRFEVK